MIVMPPVQQALHAYATFDTPAEQLRVMSRHLADGVAAGQLAIGLIDDVSAGELADALERDGVDVLRQLASGALRIRSARTTYLPDGRFDPGRMIATVAAAERDATLAGYRGLCAAGDMGWALNGAPGSDRLVEYEYRVQRTVFARLHVIGLCQYDATRFDPQVLRLVAAAHAVRIATVTGTARDGYATRTPAR